MVYSAHTSRSQSITEGSRAGAQAETETETIKECCFLEGFLSRFFPGFLTQARTTGPGMPLLGPARLHQLAIKKMSADMRQAKLMR